MVIILMLEFFSWWCWTFKHNDQKFCLQILNILMMTLTHNYVDWTMGGLVLPYSFYWGKIKKEVKRFVENAWKKGEGNVVHA